MARLVESTHRAPSQGAKVPRRTLVIVEAPGAESTRLRTLAGRAGFRVVSATSGHMVHTVARRSTPDLIVLTPETGPPGPSEIARLIKESSETREIPVVHVIHSLLFDEMAPRAYPTEAVLAHDAPDEDFLKTMRMLTSRAPKMRYTKRANAPLEGDLASDTFPEVLQFLFATAKTGRITVSDGRRRGSIAVEAGRVVYAAFGEIEGASAFRNMCFLQHGWFRFEPGAAPPRRTMRADGLGLLLETARRKDTSDRDTKPRLLTREAARGPSREPLRPPRRAAPRRAKKKGWFGALGLVLVVGVLLLAAIGVYAWTAI
jgi:hypothetical protein